MVKYTDSPTKWRSHFFDDSYVVSLDMKPLTLTTFNLIKSSCNLVDVTQKNNRQ